MYLLLLPSTTTTNTTACYNIRYFASNIEDV